MNKRHLLLAAGVACALPLAACGKHDAAPAPDDTGTAAALAPSGSSLPDALDQADGMQTTAEALKETGIAGVFKGNGSYTLLAPSDDAYAALGDQGKQLTQSDDHSALAALLRGHMLTGYVTPQDLAAAIDAKGGSVKMPTVAGDELTFSKSGDAIKVTAPDGSEATLGADAVAGGSSVAIPIDHVLKKV